MDWIRRLSNNRLQHAHRSILTKVAIMSFITTAMTSTVLPDHEAAGSGAEANAISLNGSLIERQAPMWIFNCYSNGQPCRGMGATSGGSQSTSDCQPVSDGCTQYSFSGAGQFTLCGYLNPDCSGENVISVNGGTVTCIELDQGPLSYLVADPNAEC